MTRLAASLDDLEGDHLEIHLFPTCQCRGLNLAKKTTRMKYCNIALDASADPNSYLAVQEGTDRFAFQNGRQPRNQTGKIFMFFPALQMSEGLPCSEPSSNLPLTQLGLENGLHEQVEGRKYRLRACALKQHRNGFSLFLGRRDAIDDLVQQFETAKEAKAGEHANDRVVCIAVDHDLKNAMQRNQVPDGLCSSDYPHLEWHHSDPVAKQIKDLEDICILGHIQVHPERALLSLVFGGKRRLGERSFDCAHRRTLEESFGAFDISTARFQDVNCYVEDNNDYFHFEKSKVNAENVNDVSSTAKHHEVPSTEPSYQKEEKEPAK